MAEKKTYEDLEEEIKELLKERELYLLTDKALRESTDVINNILSASPIGIGMLENRIFKHANKTMMDLFKWDNSEDYVGKSTKIIFISEEDYIKTGEFVYKNLRKKNSVQIDTPLKKMDGTQFFGNIKISTQDSKNPMNKTIITISDISRRKRTEKELLEKEKLQGVIETAGSICHELNQPIQSVFFEFAELKYRGIEDKLINSSIGNMKKHIDRISNIVKKLKNITIYETRDYVDGNKIIDIDKSSTEE
ncbi:MAG: PAS domain S-box protein [Desulfobacterales bacterium]|nr:PAS domain S-box protein [Desulfobacterales bacterium]